MLRTNILMLFLLTSAGALMHENVFFHKIGGFSMSRSKWLISFVIDLSTYERFLERLTGDINKVAIMTDKVLNAADIPEHSRLRNEYKAVLDGMRGEISVIKGVHADIVESFNDYRLLKETDGQGRHKRKVFGFIGDLMSDIFDVATNAEISSIQRNVYKLAANQDTLMHVVEESLSILNVSRMEIKENRQRINDLLMLTGSVEDKVINMSNHLEQEIREARTIVVLFSRLNTLIGELKLALSRSMYFYVHFQIQIQAVAMQKLSPTTIPAERLRNMLLEIKDKLPQTVGLPRDPRAHLFDYYKLLSCIPIFDGKHIIISIRVPLVEYSQQFDIFRAYSLPVPLLGRTRVDKDDKKLLAYYKLESNYLAINSDRSQYILLTETQVKDCVQSGLQICNVKSPIRNANVGLNCLLSNFNQDKVHVKKFCNVWIHQTTLPTAFYLSNDVYLVILDKPTVFHLSCKKEESGRQQVDPPFGFLTLHKSCQATSNHFSLLGYFEGRSTENIENFASNMLKDYNISDLRVWDDINRIVPFSNDTIKIPPKLANLEDFPLGNLIEDLHNKWQIEPIAAEHFPLWGYLIIVMSVIIILCVLATYLLKCKFKILKNMPCLVMRKPKIREGLKTKPSVTEGDDNMVEVATSLLTDIERPTTSNRIIKEKFVVLDTK